MSEKNAGRDAAIKDMRAAGKSYAQIARTVGLSRERVRQIINKKQAVGDFSGLSTRTAFALMRAGVMDLAQLDQALNNGLLVYNVGCKGVKEIEKMIGRSVEAKKVLVTTEYCGRIYVEHISTKLTYGRE